MNDSDSKRRWFHPKPGWLVLLSLATTGFLFLSEQYRWFAFNQHKGWTVLISVESVAAVLLAMLLWWIAALIFRWRFQFSIRSLLVLALAVALPCSWLAVAAKRAREQRDVVEAIELAGGSVGYDYDYGHIDQVSEPSERYWLTKLLTRHFFDKIDAVVNPPDVVFERLARMDSLSWLVLSGTSATDARLDRWCGVIQIRRLDILDTAITDAGFEHIEQMLDLRALHVTHANIHNAGLASIGKVHRLSFLGLEGTMVTADGVKSLRRILPNCDVTLK